MNKRLLEIDKYFDTIKSLYETDKELLNKFHVWAGCGLDACAHKTTFDLLKAGAVVHELLINDKLVGYYGKEIKDNKEYLTGWFLHPEHRTKEEKLLFWNTIKLDFSSDFYIGVFQRNIRAEKFLLANGCENYDFVFTPEGIAKVFIYRRV